MWFFDRLFCGSRAMAWTLGPGIALLLASLPSAFDTPPGLHSKFLWLVVVEAAGVLLVLALVVPRRFPWAGRAFAAIFGGACSVGLVTGVLENPTFEEGLRRVVPFFLFALPALRYAARGGAASSVAGDGILAGAEAPPPATGQADTSAAPVSGGGDVAASFAAKVSWLLACHPDLPHDGELGPEGGAMRFPTTAHDGFDVFLAASPHEIVIYAGDLAHRHFVREAADDVAASAFVWLRTLLGPGTRLCERLAGPAPYFARVEVRTDSGWQLGVATARLLWNYFGRRSRRVLQNRQLPARA